VILRGTLCNCRSIKLTNSLITGGETKALTHHRPSYVLFDVGNVLVHIEPAAFLRSLSIDTFENRRDYQSRIIDIVKRYEKGISSTEEFFANLDMLFNGRDKMPQRNHGGKEHYSPDEFRNAMLSIVGVQVEGMEEIVGRIGTSVPLGLLSNTNPVHFDYCLQTFRVLQKIPTHFLSYQLNALKPEPEIFARVTKQIPFPPGEILYIDDLAENVAAARAAGFLGHQFIGVKDIEQLFSELKLI
jgi:FMN phosphatase YigB (HAD superfamily)